MEKSNATWWGWMVLTFIAALTCVLCQAEEPDQDEARHVPIGVRCMSVDDMEAMIWNNPVLGMTQEEQEVLYCQEQGQGTQPPSVELSLDDSPQDVLANAEEEQSEPLNASCFAQTEGEAGLQPLFQGFKKDCATPKGPWHQKSAFFTSSPTVYAGSVHHVMFKAAGGYTLELEDGSIWAVSDADAPYIVSPIPGHAWEPWHDVILVPDNIPWYAYFWKDQDFYTSYGSFRLINLSVKGHNTIQIAMKMGPFYDRPFTRWIQAIKYDTMEIRLNDGSHWVVHSSDWDVFRLFQPNDTIIVGTNDGWSSYSFPNMLNNVNMYNPFYRQVKPLTSRVRAVQVY